MFVIIPLTSAPLFMSAEQLHPDRFTPLNLRATALSIARPLVGNNASRFLSALEQGTPGEAFDWLSYATTNTRGEFVSRFFTSPKLAIPNGGNVSRFVLDIFYGMHNFSQKVPTESQIRVGVRDYLFEFRQQIAPVKIIRDAKERDALMYQALTAPSDLNKARDDLRKTMEGEGGDKKGIADISGRREAYNAVAHIVYEGINRSTGWAAVPLTFGVLYEVLADVMPRDLYVTNPYGSWKELYLSGALPIDMIGSEFYVYSPQ